MMKHDANSALPMQMCYVTYPREDRDPELLAELREANGLRERAFDNQVRAHTTSMTDSKFPSTLRTDLGYQNGFD